MKSRNGSVTLLVSVIIPKSVGEQHLALFVHDVQSDLFLRIHCSYSSVRSKGEKWIWIDWQQAFRFWVHWIRRRYRSTMQRLSSLLRSEVAAPTEKSKNTSESATRPHRGPLTAWVRPADTEKLP